MELSVTFQFWISNLNRLWSENTLCIISLLNVLRWFCGPGCGLFCYMFHEHLGKRMYSAVIEWKALWISLRICWLSSPTSLLTFLSSYLSVVEMGVLKCATVIVDLSLFPFGSIHFCFTHFPPLLFGAYTFKVAILLGGLTFCCYIMFFSVVVFFVLKSTLSNVSIAMPISLWLLFAYLFSSWLCNYLKSIFVDLI